MGATSRRGATIPVLALSAIVALGLAGCAQPTKPDGSSRALAVSVALARPPATDAPAADPSASITPSPTPEPTTALPTEQTPTTPSTPATPTTPVQTPTASDTTQAPSPSEDSASADASSPSASEPADDRGAGIPPWIPLVAVGGLVLGAILLLARRSRTRRWDDTLGVEQDQARWVLDELMPAMTNPATPPAALAAYWAQAQPTLDELGSGLAALLADAPDPGRGAAAQTLAGAVGEVRQAVSADVTLRTAAGGAPGPIGPSDETVVVGAAAAGPVDPAALAASAARVASARDRLAAALAAF